MRGYDYDLVMLGQFEKLLTALTNAERYEPGVGVVYFQPHTNSACKKLAIDRPSLKCPVRAWFSTTDHINQITHFADVISYLDKSKVTPKKAKWLDAQIKAHGADEGYYTDVDGVPCRPLFGCIRGHAVSEFGLEPIHVGNFVKLSDGRPHQERTQGGRWSYVRPLMLEPLLRKRAS